jgi:hypothetical protein
MERTTMVKKLAEETAKAVEEAEAAAETSGTANPALEPDKIKTPLPGTTGDLDVVTTDEATSLNPNVTVSGTKPDGEGGPDLLVQTKAGHIEGGASEPAPAKASAKNAKVEGGEAE